MSLQRVLTAACLCLFGWVVPAAHGAPTWLPPQTLSDPAHPALARQSAQTMGAGGDIAAAWAEEGGDIAATVRPASSTSFSPREVLSTPGDHVGYPSVAINALGTVVVAWIDETAEHYEIALRPAGGTFSTPIAAGPTGGGLQTSTSVAIDDSGDVLLGESDFQGIGHTYRAAYAWRPAGGTFAITPVSEPASEAGQPVVAMNEAGDAVIAWEDRLGAVHTVARAIERPANGAFGSAHSLSNNSEYAFAIGVAAGGDGRIAVVWQYGSPAPPYRIEASASPSPSTPLSAPQTISPPVGNGEYPTIGVADDGEVLAAWDEFGAAGTVDAASASAGAGFSPAFAVSKSGSVGDPRIALDAGGDALIGWGASTAGIESVQAVTRSGDGVLGDEVTLSAPGEEIPLVFGNVPSAVVGMSTAGEAIAGWERASDKTLQERIYASEESAPAPTLPGNPAPAASVGVIAGARVLGCAAPRLTGMSKVSAKRHLLAAHCALGKVSIPRRYRHSKRLVVSAQSIKAGTRLAAGTKVTITLKPLPPRHHNNRHH